jgi:hypothetical protein
MAKLGQIRVLAEVFYRSASRGCGIDGDIISSTSLTCSESLIRSGAKTMDQFKLLHRKVMLTFQAGCLEARHQVR